MKAGNLTIKWAYNSKISLCTIVNVGFEENGQAVCSDKDNFRKDTGRKISLARAMKSANLPKEERTVIWELYRNMKKGGRW